MLLTCPTLRPKTAPDGTTVLAEGRPRKNADLIKEGLQVGCYHSHMAEAIGPAKHISIGVDATFAGKEIMSLVAVTAKDGAYAGGGALQSCQ